MTKGAKKQTKLVNKNKLATKQRKSVKKQATKGQLLSKKQPFFAKKIRFTIKDVRCFAGEQVFEIRPLTFLTGENSTGKTTFLGCFHAFCDYNSISHIFDFNHEPYQMGSFDTIVRQGKTGKDQSFELGLMCPEEPKMEYQVRFSKDNNTIPLVSRIKILMEDIEAIFKWNKKTCNVSLTSNSDKISQLIKSIPFSENSFLHPHPFLILQAKLEETYIRRNEELEKEVSKELDQLKKKIETSKSDSKKVHKNRLSTIEKKIETSKKEIESIGQIDDLLEKANTLWEKTRGVFPPRLINSAPIRSKPQRYYNAFMQRNYDPEGGDIPAILMEISIQNKKGWKELSKKLIDFGQSAELFDNIEIKQTGKSPGNPFEIQLQVKGVQSNLTDTGYGISQVLPILGHIFFSPPKSCFLLQQPEVHLHPRAQAALSSLFIETAKNDGKSFLIETHSDYMLDRARIEIRQGKIPPDQVSLIYLESCKGKVQVHNLFFDSEGRLKNPPAGYRDFFVKEMDRFLGVPE